MSTAEMMGETFNNEGEMYQLTLNICFALLAVGMLCGCIYEVLRRKKLAATVEPEGDTVYNLNS